MIRDSHCGSSDSSRPTSSQVHQPPAPASRADRHHHRVPVTRADDHVRRAGRTMEEVPHLVERSVASETPINAKRYNAASHRTDVRYALRKAVHPAREDRGMSERSGMTPER